MRKLLSSFAIGTLILLAPAAWAQTTESQERHERRERDERQERSLINIRVSRTTQTVNYRDRTATKIDFQGTPLMPRAQGKAEINARGGRIAIKAEFEHLQRADSFGPVYMTYVLWAISPEGQANNLGEIVPDDGKSKLEVTTNLQTFGMIVTAEPYFAVTFPSEVVIAENVVRKDTKGSVSSVDAKYDLLQRGTYDDLRLPALEMESSGPLALYQARNAMRIARAARAKEYAAESWEKAQASLSRAEDYQVRKQHKAVITAAREAVQAAEDARSIAVKRQEDERITMQQRAADAEAARAREAQEQEARGRDEAERQQRDAERQRKEAEQAQAREASARADADAARQAAEQQERAAREREALAAQQAAAASEQAQQAQSLAQRAQESAEQSEREKQELRAKLLEQFNRVLETRDTVRGLVVNVGDVLFDTAKFTLRPPAREALAKLSGIVLAYPGLRLQVEGHTDSTGTPAFNQKLSEQRAGSVRDFLVQQGVNAGSITAAGLGQDMPVADNGSPAGRQKNRRVEIIVSGEVIGTKIGSQR